jgi:hypothetical protein
MAPRLAPWRGLSARFGYQGAEPFRIPRILINPSLVQIAMLLSVRVCPYRQTVGARLRLPSPALLLMLNLEAPRCAQELNLLGIGHS